ncbi:MAG: hypothetical protein ABSD53_03380 [Terriglobales bacterium]
MKHLRHTFCMAVIVLVWIPLQASAQLMLDDFTSGAYVKHLNTGLQQDRHYAKLAPGSLLGPARQTDFSIGPNYYKQGATLSIGKGIWILDAGFGTVGATDITYGVTLTGANSPLSLNLEGYSGFRLNFAGVASSEDLGVIIVVFPHNGDNCASEVVLPTYANPISIDFPFSGFNKPGGLTQADASDIDYIVVEAYGGGFASFGITSFQAVQ